MRLSVLIIALLASLLAGPTVAGIKIPEAYRRVADEYNVPAGILFAIAHQNSDDYAIQLVHRLCICFSTFC